MSTPLQRAYRFCLGDGSLTIAVFILIFFAFVLYPMVEVGVIRRFWLDMTFAAFLAMGAVVVFEPRPIVRLFLVFLTGAVVTSLADHFFEDTWISALRAVFAMLACAVLGVLLMVRVIRDGRMNLNRLMGAIGVVPSDRRRIHAGVSAACRICPERVRDRRNPGRFQRDQSQAQLLQFHYAHFDGLRGHYALASLRAFARHSRGAVGQPVPDRSGGAAGRAGNRLAARTARPAAGRSRLRAVRNTK